MIFKSAKHCRHAAGTTAISALIVPIAHLPHILEPTLFCISALLTVYEPLLVREIHLIEVPPEDTNNADE